jgi:hypothetical protein
MDVDEGDVGPQRSAERHGFRGIRCDRHRIMPRILQEALELERDQDLVLDDQDSKGWIDAQS